MAMGTYGKKSLLSQYISIEIYNLFPSFQILGLFKKNPIRVSVGASYISKCTYYFIFVQRRLIFW